MSFIHASFRVRNSTCFSVCMNRIRKSSPMLIERIQLHIGFVVQLRTNRIISEEEFDQIQHTIEHEPCDQMCSGESNLVVVNSLVLGSCKRFLRFLQLLEEDCQIHLVNYIISFSGILHIIVELHSIDTTSNIDSESVIVYTTIRSH